ncbi:hypothetical protein BDW66DRAFT_131905 [Aspergillus desertorum]
MQYHSTHLWPPPRLASHASYYYELVSSSAGSLSQPSTLTVVSFNLTFVDVQFYPGLAFLRRGFSTRLKRVGHF